MSAVLGAFAPPESSLPVLAERHAEDAVPGVRLGRRAFASGPSAWSEGDVVAVVRGSPQWAEGGASLGVGGAGVQNGAESAAKAVLEGWKRHGDALFERLGGTFAVAILDGAADRAVLAVDRIGVERMAWAHADGILRFGTSAEAVARTLKGGARIRLQSVFDYLFFHMVPSPATLFEGVSKLPPASVLVASKGTVAVRRYWQPTFASPGGGRAGGNGAAGGSDVARLGAELHESLARGVRESGLGPTTGAFLSGGLDSSTVAGVLGKVSGRAARTFSIGFGHGLGADDYDELAYARIAARHFGCDATEYVARAEDVTAHFPAIARAYDEPFGNSSALPALTCALLAREHGIDHLLAGDGGDELFGGNSRYATQAVFERYQRVPALLRRGLMEPVLLNLPSFTDRIGLLRKAGSYVRQASVPLPRRLETWNLLEKLGLDMLLAPEFRAAIDEDAPLRHMDDVYASAPAGAAVLDKLLYYDWRFTLADNDLRKVETMCELAGVRVSYPMLHTSVVEMSTRVPPDLKMRGTTLRWFYKQAMADFLPREIIEKKKHGFGLPFGFWLQDSAPMQELIYGNLASLRTRGIIRPELIDDLRRLNAGADAGYYGVLIWVLAMLEQWFQEHRLAP